MVVNSNEALDRLIEIQQQLSKKPESDLILLSIDEIKEVVELIRQVAIGLVYPLLNKAAQLEFINVVKKKDLNINSKFSQISDPEIQLQLNKLFEIFKLNDDVSKQLQISNLLPYFLFAFSFNCKQFDLLVKDFPTFHLYKLLMKVLMLNQNNAMVKYKISSVLVNRRDAVLSLVEIVCREELSMPGIKQIVLILTSPISVPVTSYIKCLGDQLFQLLLSPDSLHNECASLITQQLALAQPKLVGELRNLLVLPFEGEQRAKVSQCLLASTRLSFYGNKNRETNMFIEHVCDRISVSVWFLCVLCFKDNSVPANVIDAMVQIVRATPQCIVKIVESLLIQHLPKNLVWHINKEGEPSLVHAVNTQDTLPSMSQTIDTRLDCLLLIMKQLNDSEVTNILLLLVKLYTLESSSSQTTNNLDDAMNVLLHAKTIERMTMDPEIKAKLFETPAAIVEFAFSVIQPSTQPTNKILEVDEMEADSDDEDCGNHDVFEDHTMLDLALSLLGTAIMESVADDDKLKITLNKDQINQLKTLTNNTSLPKQLRGRAGFCLELVSDKEDNKTQKLNTNTDILKAAEAALSEPLVPSRAYGLHLISNLLEKRGISLKAAMEIFIRELGDDDSYIYLNALKGIEAAGRTNDSSKCIDLIFKHIDSSNKELGLDHKLRCREALIRLLSPGSLQTINLELISILVKDITAKAEKDVDLRFRLSSAAILGIIIAQYPLSVPAHMQLVVADCALGILRHENDTSLRRAATVLCLEIVNAVNSNEFSINKSTLDSLKVELEKIRSTSADHTLVEHCEEVLNMLSN